MNTVLCIDLQPHTIAILLGNILVHPRGAKPLLGAVINREVPIDRYGVIPESQMCRLIPLVICTAQGDGRQQIKAYFPVGFRILNRLTFFGGLQVLRVRFAVFQSPWLLAAEDVVENARVQHGAIKTQGAVK